MNLEFEVTGQRIINRSATKLVVGDSQNYLYGEFFFSDEWQDVEKTAVFTQEEVIRYVLADGDNRCVIPWEVIKPPFFTVSVFGGDRITTNTAMVRVTPSGLENGKPPEPPTPDIYTQLLRKITRKADGMIYEGGVLQLMSEGTPVGNGIELSIGGDCAGKALYVLNFVEEDWLDRGIHWELQIPKEVHNLGYSAAVMELVRKSENGLECVLCHTVQLPNGTISVTADMAFAGRAYLERV